MSVIDKMQFKDTISGDPITVDIGCDYSNVNNKPQINDVTLIGNKSLSDLGIAGEDSTLSIDEAREYELIEGKNLYNWGNIPFTLSKNGITTTVVKNADGTIQYFDFDGTATNFTGFNYINLADNANSYHLFPEGDYVLDDKAGYVTGTTLQDKRGIYTFIPRKKGASGTTINGWDTATETHSRRFTIDYDEADYFDLSFVIWGGTVLDHYKLYPMLCTQEEWYKDNSYSPYYVPVKDSKLDIVDQQVLGAWNLMPMTLPSQSINGLTITVDSDNVIDINGTASKQTILVLKRKIGTLIPGKTYYLSGITGGSLNTYFMTYNNDSESLYYINLYDGFGEFTAVDESTYPNTFVALYIRSGVTMNHVKVKPMISLEPNQPYVPHAMTNRKLTEEKTGTCTATISSNNATLESVYYVIIGKVMWVYVSVKTTSAIANADRIIITLTGLPSRNALGNSIFVPCFGKEDLIAWFGASNPNSLTIQNNGTELASNKTLQLSGCIPV